MLNKSRVCSHAMPCKEEEDDSHREYLRRQFKGTIKRAKKQKYFGFSKREYLRRKFNGTINPKSLISA